MTAGTLKTCPGSGSRICDRSGFECRCSAGTWQCITVSQGMGVCGCEVDAAGDAADAD